MRPFIPFIPSFLSILLASTGAAFSSSSAWHHAEGVRMRILTKGQPDAKGMLQGALQIDLKRGWKTYWRDPGSSGVPPSVDIASGGNVASAELAYPPPMRFDDASGPWTGYKHSVTFPISFRLVDAGAPASFTAQVFIGACETVCLPVQAELAIDAASEPDNPDDAAIIDDALARLPREATPEFGATVTSAEADTIQVEARLAGEPDGVDLFVAGVDGYALGMPQKAQGAFFSVQLLERPAEKPAGKGLPYTLVTKAGAVQGFLPYP